MIKQPKPLKSIRNYQFNVIKAYVYLISFNSTTSISPQSLSLLNQSYPYLLLYIVCFCLQIFQLVQSNVFKAYIHLISFNPIISISPQSLSLFNQSYLSLHKYIVCFCLQIFLPNQFCHERGLMDFSHHSHIFLFNKCENQLIVMNSFNSYELNNK